MALIVEDGSGLSTSESYATVAYANTYHYNRGNTTWAAFTPAVKEQLLRKATDYMLQEYRAKWKGTRVLDTQALDWPREYVYIDNANDIDSDIVPTEVQKACCEFALRSNDGALLEDASRVTILEKVDVLEVEYSDNGNSSNYVRYAAIDKMLEPYLMAGAAGSMTARVGRA